MYLIYRYLYNNKICASINLTFYPTYSKISAIPTLDYTSNVFIGISFKTRIFIYYYNCKNDILKLVGTTPMTKLIPTFEFTHYNNHVYLIKFTRDFSDLFIHIYSIYKNNIYLYKNYKHTIGYSKYFTFGITSDVTSIFKTRIGLKLSIFLSIIPIHDGNIIIKKLFHKKNTIIKYQTKFYLFLFL